LFEEQPTSTSEHVSTQGEPVFGISHTAELLCCCCLLLLLVLDAAICGQGCTHPSSPALPEDGLLSGVVWEAPIDICLSTSSMRHWPVLVFKLFHRSVWLGR
jgi:hypothetical protein